MRKAHAITECSMVFKGNEERRRTEKIGAKERFNYRMDYFRDSVRDKLVSRKKLRELAYTDQLTGLGNRHYLERELKKAYRKYKRRGASFAVVYMDLDEFKPINDIHGHDMGDRALVEVANRINIAVPLIKSTSRPTDALVRMGGDEFVVVLTGTGGDGANSFIKRLSDNLASKPIAIDGITFSISASAGHASLPEDSVLVFEMMLKSSAINSARHIMPTSALVDLADVRQKERKTERHAR